MTTENEVQFKEDLNFQPPTGDGEPPRDDKPPYTQGGNGQRLLQVFGGDIRYCDNREAWFFWNGERWQKDTKKGMHVFGMMQSVIDAMRKRAEKILNDSELEEQIAAIREAKCEESGAGKWTLRDGQELTEEESAKIEALQHAGQDYAHALKSDNAPYMAGSVEMARARCVVNFNVFDSNPMLFNCESGTIDLRTEELLPHRREDFCSRIAPVKYNILATCPKFEDMLQLMYEDNPENIEYLQDFFGLALTGLVPQDIVLLIGSGNNAKSTLVETIRQGVLGEVTNGGYAYTASTNTLITGKFEGGGHGPESGIAAMVGARLICSAEYTRRVTLNMGLLKALTGGESKTTRDMYESQINFDPQGSIIIISNEKPRIDDDTEGSWRRLPVVRSDVDIPAKLKALGRNEVQNFRAVLVREEASGILNWMLEGLSRCLSRYEEGGKYLHRPVKVVEDTLDYRKEQSHAFQFLEGCVHDPDARVGSSALYAAYEQYCARHNIKGEGVVSQKAIAAEIKRYYPEVTSEKERESRRAYWKGLGLPDGRDNEF